MALSQELRRTIRRASRQKREALDAGRGSRTVDDALNLVDQISGTRAAGVHGLAVKLWAVAWSLEETDAVLDVKGLRQLRALVREARML